MPTQAADQLIAGVGWRNAASGARQEPHANAFFEAAHGMTQRGPGHADALRSAGEASLLGHGQKRRQDVQIVELHW